MAAYRNEELLIGVLARLLAGARHVAVGAVSPIPGTAALLARALSVPNSNPFPFHSVPFAQRLCSGE